MNFTGTKIFFDTNILCYALDNYDSAKKQKAENIISNAVKSSNVYISTQVIQEMCNVSIKKLCYTKQELQNIIDYFSRLFTVSRVSIHTIKNALYVSERHQFSFWDSLILASAIEAGCDILYTEDLNNGQVVEGVRIVNPFVA